MLAVDTFIQRLLFKPLPKSGYDFSFRHRKRHLVHIPVDLSNSTSGDGRGDVRGPLTVAEQHAFLTLKSGYFVPAMWIPRSGGDGEGTADAPRRASRRRLLIVHFHGTSGDIEKSHLWATMHDRIPDADVLLVEFPGYAIASPVVHGTGQLYYSSCDTTTAVARAVLSHCIQRLNVPERDIVLAGRSMGSGIAVRMAREFPGVAGLLLISPYSTIANIVRDVKPPVGRLLQTVFWSKRYFDSATDICHVLCPVLICHGAKDRLIRLTHAHALRDAATRASSVELHVDPSGSHTDLVYEDSTIEFLRRLMSSGEGGAVQASESAKMVPPPLIDVAVYNSPALVEELRRRLEADRALFAREVRSSRRRLLFVCLAVALGAIFVVLRGRGS